MSSSQLTIFQRGRSTTNQTWQARIAGALGGRAAEQLVFGTNQVTTGHGDDCGSGDPPVMFVGLCGL